VGKATAFYCFYGKGRKVRTLSRNITGNNLAGNARRPAALRDRDANRDGFV